MPDHIANRDRIIQDLREELVGPSPQGKPINCSGPIKFESDKDFYGPWRQENGEEILQRDPPTVRYGVGVLYPLGTPADNQDSKSSQEDKGVDQDAQPDTPDEAAALIAEEARQNLEDIAKKIEAQDSDKYEAESDDFELSTANAYKPSSIGISFLAEFPKGSVLKVEAVNCGRYRLKKVQVSGNERKWWLRSAVNFIAEFTAEDICSDYRKAVSREIDGLKLSIEVFSRPDKEDRSRRLLTVCLINRSHSGDDNCLFQAGFKAIVVSPKEEAHILPYPGARLDSDRDEEEKSLALLYRKMETYAVGHGCAADWDKEAGAGKAKTVRAECLPTFETSSITPDITRENGSKLEVPMAPLAGLVPGEDGLAALEEVVNLYEEWISAKKAEIASLEEKYQDAANAHMDECERAAQSIRTGLTYLQNDGTARRAFQLANHAILLQQISSSRREPRRVQYDSKAKRYTFSEPYQAPNLLQTSTERGKWRAFQIAFLLMSIQSTAEGYIPERQTVELIWFPTGGGKTEAYLGLSAFALFMRRLKNPDDAGVHVLMRYTLRLLTAQQFQRASALLCAMEYLRRQNVSELGEIPFSIGIWVGGETTPNTCKQAVSALRELESKPSAENPFILSRCPWCSAQMGRWHLGKNRLPSGVRKVLGYEQRANTVIFKCSDRDCEFHNQLPVYAIDEDIYETRPSLVMGTVDKFAMLAWRPQARTLFGIAANGERQSSPPGLIIQDELHLISGPLGSVVGLYETVIEELCTYRVGRQEIKPKIVCSTATIRRYADQVRALYGREEVALFPPPGIDADDSFFSRYARNPDGTLQRGRIYAGVHAPSLRSLLTVQQRVFASVLQTPVPFSPEERDPWWTLLLFFNSLKELGNGLSLLQSDIAKYLRVIQNRLGLEGQQVRRLWRILELTGRIRSDKVPEAIAALEVKCDNANNQHPVDVCLSSNIIEVGVDIDRLSLMGVAGQPKSTSQYIQVTGRVGRKWWERPGLVITTYSPTKPRDRSHFEKFRSYHERLYSQVEPTSVTPFSPPVLDRALHAVMAVCARQAGDEAVARNPYPYPENLIENLRQILMRRIERVDPDELDNFQRVFDKRASEWQRWQHTRWEKDSKDDQNIPQLRVAGAYASPEEEMYSWAIPMSMRNVDAECQAEITLLYLSQGGEENA